MNKLSKKISCPICGSQNIDTSTIEEGHSLPFGVNFSINISNNVCKECGAEGDFEKKNDSVFEEAQKKALTESVILILENLSQSGFTNAQIERTLSLPPRTLARWKSGAYSDAAITLLRIVATYPWIMDVARNEFNKRHAEATLIIHAGIALANLVGAGISNVQIAYHVQSKPQSFHLNAQEHELSNLRNIKRSEEQETLDMPMVGAFNAFA